MRISDIASAARIPAGELRRSAVRKGYSAHRDGNSPDRAADARIVWDVSGSSE